MGFLKIFFSIAVFVSATELVSTDGFKIQTVSCAGDASTMFSHAESMAVDANGKILTSGRWDSWTEPCLQKSGPRVFRFNPDGSLDKSFGNGGVIRVMPEISDFLLMVKKILVLPDGKILVTGGGSSEDMFVARLNSDGSYDRTFGFYGRVLISFEREARARDLLVTKDSKILIVGYDGLTVNAGHSDWALIKLNTDGTRDYSFGENGIVRLSLSENGIAGLNRVVEDSKGRFIVTGETYTNLRGFGTTTGSEISRFLPNGEIDQSFAKNGLVHPYSGNNSDAQDLFLLPDGSFFFVNWMVEPANFQIRITKYFSNGTVDSSFGKNGDFIIPLVHDSFWQSSKIIQAPNGNFLIYGNDKGPGEAFVHQGFVVSMTPNGQLDTHFASGGRLDLHFAINTSITDLKPFSGGFYLLGDTGEDYSTLSMYLGKFDWDGNPDKTFGK